jgi:hypothetical protein
MVCAFCKKDVGERDTFTILEGVPYHNECFDRHLRAQEQAAEGKPPPER